MAQQTYYDLLGVSQNATIEEIRAAFASKYRSFQVLVGDPNPEKAEYAQRMLRWLQDANTILSDPEKRRQYDVQVEAQRQAEQEQLRKLQEQQALAEYQRQQQMQQVISDEVQKREQAIRNATNQEIEKVREQKTLGSTIGSGVWGLILAPMLFGFCCGLVFLREFGSALWLGILGALLTLSGTITGIIPLAGQYFHYLLVYNQILPWWESASGIHGHWIVMIPLALSFLSNISVSISVAMVIGGIIYAIKNS